MNVMVPTRSVMQGVLRLRTMVVLLMGVLLPGALPALSQDWQLVWSDEFDAGILPDPQRWSYQTGGGGWGNQELQYYTDARPENARIENGSLIIEARAESFQGASYTSARLNTRGKGDWLYGRMEMRAKLPAGLGTWPAFWMMPSEGAYGDGGWPDNGEIDIMEAVGHEPDRSHSAVHMNDLNHQLGNNPSATFIRTDSRTAFHTYAVEWTPTRITTFVDDEQGLVYQRDGADWERWPFDRPFHIIINLAVGGTWGGAQGVNASDFPARYEIDYIRVFEDASGPPTVSLATADGSTEFTVGQPISFEVRADDPASSITDITLFQQEAPLASVRNADELNRIVEGAAPGCYRVHAVARDAEGWVASSDTLSIQVDTSCGQAPYLMVPASIPGRFEAEYYDLGGPGESYQDLTASNTGDGIRQQEGVDIGTASDVGGGYQLENMTLREWVEYTVRVEETGTYRLVSRLAATRDGQFRIAVDGVEWSEPLSYRSTNSTTFFRNAVLDGVVLEKGDRVIRFMFDSFGAYVNWFEFQSVSGTAVEEPTRPTDFAIDVYPNPVQDRIHIRFNEAVKGPLHVQLLDITGRMVLDHTISSGTWGGIPLEIDLPSQLASGAYLLVLQGPAATRTQVLFREGIPR